MQKSSHRSPWFARFKEAPNADWRLFCFPYAGGSASVFRPWASLLPDSVELFAVQYPGRGTRHREQPLISVWDIVDGLMSECSAFDEGRPYAFFGHSMGALVAFELACRLRSESQFLPMVLFVSARKAPQIASRETQLHLLPEPDFLREIRQMNGAPKEVLEHEELMALASRTLRADFATCETYRYTDRAPLICPITAFGGRDDLGITGNDLEAWRCHTTSSFHVHKFPGDHFFITKEAPTILHLVCDQLRQGR